MWRRDFWWEREAGGAEKRLPHSLWQEVMVTWTRWVAEEVGVRGRILTRVKVKLIASADRWKWGAGVGRGLAGAPAKAPLQLVLWVAGGQDLGFGRVKSETPLGRPGGAVEWAGSR